MVRMKEEWRKGLGWENQRRWVGAVPRQTCGVCRSHPLAPLSLSTSLPHLLSGNYTDLAERAQTVKAKQLSSSIGPVQGQKYNRHSEYAK